MSPAGIGAVTDGCQFCDAPTECPTACVGGPRSMSAEELDMVRASLPVDDNPLADFGPGTVRRLLATIAARDAEIARLKGEANDASASLARIMECIADDGTRIAVGVLDQRIREADAEIARLVEMERADALQARVAQLEAALRPFAEIGTSPDRTFDYYTPAARFEYEFTHAQVAAARKAMGWDK